MYKKVDTSMHFVEREKEVIEFWKENDVFEDSVREREGGEEFSFYDGPPDGERQAAHRAYPHARHEGHHPPLSDDEGQARPAQGGLGYARAARRAGSGKVPRHGRQAGHRKIRHRALHQKVQGSVWKYKGEWEKMSDRVGYWADMEHPYVTYRRQLHRVGLVGAQGDLEKGPAVQGAQDRPVLPALRHGALLARGRAGL